MELNKKKVLVLSTGDINGAYEAAYKLCLIIKEMGHDIAMVVKNRTKTDTFIFESPQKKQRFRKTFFKYLKSFFIHSNHRLLTVPEYSFISINESKENIKVGKIIEKIGFVPEYVFVGMTDNFLNSTDLYNIYKETHAKIINITVDMNHFTGGCHYAWECNGYIKGCHSQCPAIIKDKEKIIAKINFDKKIQNAKSGCFNILAASGWTEKQAKESLIYKDQKNIENINSLIDITIFNNSKRHIAKEIFGFNKDKIYILSGAQSITSKRKGGEYFFNSLDILEKKLTSELKKKIEILIVSRTINKNFDKIKFSKKYIDYITDYRLLALLYQAADIFVNSSIEDSGPMMVSEALACGTPVVGFDMGVVNNMVITGYNGYKAKLKDSNDLAVGIEKILKLSEEEYLSYSLNSVKQVEKYSSYDYATKVLEKIMK